MFLNNLNLHFSIDRSLWSTPHYQSMALAQNYSVRKRRRNSSQWLQQRTRL